MNILQFVNKVFYVCPFHKAYYVTHTFYFLPVKEFVLYVNIRHINVFDIFIFYIAYKFINNFMFNLLLPKGTFI